MRITHVVCTTSFAGAESHVAALAAAQHDRGHEVVVLGGDPHRMREAIDRPRVTVRPVSGIADTVRQLTGAAGARADVVATHMTAADVAAALCPRLWRTPIVSTRHFAAPRGSTALVRVLLRPVARRITAEIAVSAHIGRAVGDRATVVLPGVGDDPHPPGAPRERTILLAQRLEAEKATDLGVRAFAASGLADVGWTLQVAGDGSLRRDLEALARSLGIGDAVTFLGYRSDVGRLMARAGILLAPCGVEGLGLAVLEAMSVGLPVVASSAGGHLETVGPVDGAALFPTGDVESAAHILSALGRDTARRTTYGAALRERQRRDFSLAGQAAATDTVYAHARSRLRPPHGAVARELVVISLEPWDEVWRRNQHLVAGLLREDPGLRVLFVEPASDLVESLRMRSVPQRGRGLRLGPPLDGVSPGALWLYQPTKPLPRRVDRGYDRRWARGVVRAARRAGLPRPVLWVNDPAGAEVLEVSGWPSVYDITDDWLAASRDAATHERLVRHEDQLMRRCTEVVVCSTGLARTKSAVRTVTLLPNAVDAEAIRRPRPRPADLPPGPVAMYVGTLHSDRLDLDLCVATAQALRGAGTLVLVGPNSLGREEDARLEVAGVVRLGARPAADVPGYLQQADVLLVPHVVDEFTESLDPIKLHEYLAVGRVVVSTPVSGFREAADARRLVVAGPDFARAVAGSIPARDAFPTGADPTVATWAQRVGEMRAVLDRLGSAGSIGTASPDDDLGRGEVPRDVRARLGHAAIQQIAEAHGVDLLHIKGAALEDALTRTGRESTDTDVLVRPQHVERFVQVAGEAGYRRVSSFRFGSPFAHAATLDHPVWGHLDVHRHFPGIGLDPHDAFDRLWEHRTSLDIGGVRCDTPDRTTHAVLLVLHAARTVMGGKATADVEHVWHHADARTRAAMRAEATALRATVAFAVGTGEDVPARDAAGLADWLAMTQPHGRLPEWRARWRTAPDVGARLRLLVMLPVVNTDQLAIRLGRRPTPVEVGRAVADRALRALAELAAGRGR